MEKADSSSLRKTALNDLKNIPMCFEIVSPAMRGKRMK